MAIPLVDGNERVDLWHPVLFARIDALCADPRMRSQLRVESAVRTRAEQVHLYQGWRNGLPGFNLAANPDQTLTPRYGLPSAQGSWHMEQPDGRGYACDFRTFGLPADVLALLEAVASEYRLIRTVPSENWHYQMDWNDWEWTPSSRGGPAPPPPPPPVNTAARLLAVRVL